MTFTKKPQDKTEFEQIKEEVSAAVQREQAAAAQDDQQEADCRRRYSAAQQEQNAALESGNMEQYRNAGLAAEAARLELEFCEKRKKAIKKPAASQEDDRRINRALNAEEARVKSEALDRLKELFTEVISICTNAGNQFNGIDSLYASWKIIVMKDGSPMHTMTDGSKFIINSIVNRVNGILTNIKTT